MGHPRAPQQSFISRKLDLNCGLLNQSSTLMRRLSGYRQPLYHNPINFCRSMGMGVIGLQPLHILEDSGLKLVTEELSQVRAGLL